jgi:hypothetical protein
MHKFLSRLLYYVHLYPSSAPEMPSTSANVLEDMDVPQPGEFTAYSLHRLRLLDI